MATLGEQTIWRQGTSQVIAFSTTVAATNAFGAQTYAVRLAADSHCNYAIGDGAQTATVASPFLPQNWVEIVKVSPGQKIAALQAASDGNVTAHSGTLWITELTA